MRLWKLAREFGLEIMVCHLPPGTSKWNRIELRLFLFISQNWRGRPPRSPLTVVSLFSATTTEAGLKVYCDVDENVYSRGIKVGDAEMKVLDVSGQPSTQSGTIHCCQLPTLMRLFRDDP